jgi:hypothetical protein
VSLTTVGTTARIFQGLIRKYDNNTVPITGMLSVGGDLAGGQVEFSISLDSGTNINPWEDMEGDQMIVTSNRTIEFKIPAINRNGEVCRIYYTYTGQGSSPNISITVVDNL